MPNSVKQIINVPLIIGKLFLKNPYGDIFAVLQSDNSICDTDNFRILQNTIKG